MTEVALCLPFADEQRLLAEAARHGHRVVARCAAAEELARQLGSPLADTAVELVVVAAASPYLSAQVVARCDELGLRLLVVAESAQERRFAASLGVVDPVDAPFEWSSLGGTSGMSAPRVTPPGREAWVMPFVPSDTVVPPDTVDEETRVRHVARPAPGAAPALGPAQTSPPLPTRGTVIAVWGPEGAPGRTSLAIALAAELAELAELDAAGGSRGIVALADADTRAASVAPALGLLDEAPGFAAACRLAGAGGLDRIQFDRIAQRHRIGRAELRVLTGIGRASRWPELTAERIAGVITAARDWAGVTVIDVAASFEQDEELMTDLHAPHRNAATVEVLGSADRVIAVGAADPIGLARLLRAHTELVELVDPDRLVTVVNKLRAGAIGAGPAAQVRQTLARFGGVDDPVLVPWDPSAFDAALLGGRALLEVAPRSAARLAIRELATRLQPAPASAAGVPRRRGARNPVGGFARTA